MDGLNGGRATMAEEEEEEQDYMDLDVHMLV